MSLLFLFRPKLTAAGYFGAGDSVGCKKKKRKKLDKKLKREALKLEEVYPEMTRGELLDLAKDLVLKQLDLLAEYEQAILLCIMLDDES